MKPIFQEGFLHCNTFLGQEISSIKRGLFGLTYTAPALKVILDLGRRPEARFLGHRGAEILRDFEVIHCNAKTLLSMVFEGIKRVQGHEWSHKKTTYRS